MKNHKIQYLVLVFLAIATCYFIFTNSQGTIKKELCDFSVADTSSVDKISIVDQDNNKIVLERNPFNWTVNTNSIARQEMVNFLLKTLNNLQVKEPVAKSARGEIKNKLAVTYIKVEIYQNGEKLKAFFVGGPTHDLSGTFMMMEHSNIPFIIEIPGFDGYVTPRFSTLEKVWKSQIVFNIPAEEISEVTVENNLTKNESFTIRQSGNYIELHSWPKNILITQFDTLQVKKYLLQCSKKTFSSFIENEPKERYDSIIASQPIYTILVKTRQGQTTQIKAFVKSGFGKVDFFGKPINKDPDNFYLLINNHDLVNATYFTFSPLFMELKSFRKE